MVRYIEDQNLFNSFKYTSLCALCMVYVIMQIFSSCYCFSGEITDEGISNTNNTKIYGCMELYI